MGLAAKSALSTRVTLVAARPDAALVLLRADDSSRSGATNDALTVSREDAGPEAPRNNDAELVSTSESVQSVLPGTVPKNADARFAARNRGASYLSPAAKYARTQGSVGEAPKGIHVDVRA